MAESTSEVILKVRSDGSIRLVNQAGQSFEDFGKKAEDSGRRADNAFASAASSSQLLTRGLTALAAAFSIRELISYADAWTLVTSRLNQAATSSSNLAAIQEQVFDIAQRTSAPLLETVTLYSRLSGASKDLGASQEQIARVVETVNKALVINGTTTQEASGALLQLSQALGGTVIQAQEYNSLIDGARPLLQAVANNFDRAGGSVSRLTQLVKEGSVSSKEFFDALVAGGNEIDVGFGKAGDTVGRAITELSNELTRFIGKLNETTGASGLLIKTIRATGDAFDYFSGKVDALSGHMSRFNAQQIIQQLAEVDKQIAITQRRIDQVQAGGTFADAILGPILSLSGGTDAVISRLTERLELLRSSQAALRAELTHTSEEAEKIGRAFNPLTDSLANLLPKATEATDLFKFLAKEQEKAERQAKQLADAYDKQRKSIADSITLLETQLEAEKLLTAGLISEAEAREMVARKQDELSGKLPEEIARLSELRTALDATTAAREAGVRAQEAEKQAREQAEADLQKIIAAERALESARNQGIGALKDEVRELEIENRVLAAVRDGVLNNAQASTVLALAKVDAKVASIDMTNATVQEKAALDQTTEALKSQIVANQQLSQSTQQAAQSQINFADVLEQVLADTIRSLGRNLGQLAGVSNSIGARIGSDIGGAIGTGIGTVLGGPIGGTIGNVIGDIAGGLFGDLIGSLFAPGRIAQAKKAANDFFKDVFGRDFDIFREVDVAGALFDAEAFRDAGFSLGLLFADGLKNATAGDPIRFGGQFLANLEDFGATAAETSAALAELARALGFSLVEAVREANEQVREGFLSLGTFAEEMDEARDNLRRYGETAGLTRQQLEELALSHGNTGSVVLDYTSTIAGAIDVQTGFSAAVDASRVAQELVAEEFVSSAREIGIAESAIESYAEKLRTGELALEEVIIALNRLDDIAGSLSLADFTISPQRLLEEVALIEASLQTLSEIGQAAGNLLADSLADGFEGTIASKLDEIFDTIFRNAIISAFQASIQAALDTAFLQPLFTDFGRALSDLIAGNITAEEFERTAREIRSNMEPAINALAEAVGVASDTIRQLLEDLGLLPAAAQNAASGVAAVGPVSPGLQADIDAFSSQSAIPFDFGAEFTRMNEEWNRLRASLFDAAAEARRTGEGMEDVTRGLADVRAAGERIERDLVDQLLAPSQQITDSILGQDAGERVRALTTSIEEQRAALEEARLNTDLSTESLNRINNELDRLAEAEVVGLQQIVDEVLRASESFTNQFLPPSLDQALRDHQEAVENNRQALENLLETGNLTADQIADVETELSRLDLADAIGRDRIYEAFSPISDFFETMRGLPELLGQNLTQQLIDFFTIDAGRIDFDNLDFSKIEAQLRDTIARATLQAVLEGATQAFITAPISAILQPVFAGVAQQIVTGSAIGAGLIASATDAFVKALDVLRQTLPALLEFFQSEEFQSFFADISGNLIQQSSSTSIGRGGGGGGGGGGSLDNAVSKLQEAIDAIRAFAASQGTATLRDTLREINTEAQQLGDDFLQQFIPANLASLIFGGLGFEDIVGQLFTTLETLAIGQARKIEEAIKAALAPVDSFLNSTEAATNALGQLSREYQTARDVILDNEEALSKYTDTIALQAAILETLNERINELVEDTLQPFADAIRDLSNADPRPITEILADLGSATTLAQIERLRDEALDAILGTLEAQKNALREEQRLQEQTLEDQIDLIDQLIRLRERLAQQELQTLRDQRSALERLIELRLEESGITEQNLTTLRNLSAGLRGNVFDQQLQAGLPASQRLEAGLDEFARLQQRILENPNDLEAIRRLQEIAGPLRQLNDLVNVGNEEGQAINTRINNGLLNVADILDAQATEVESQLALLQAQNGTLSEIQSLVAALGLSGNETVQELRNLLSETDAQISTLEGSEDILAEIRDIEQQLGIDSGTSISELQGMRSDLQTQLNGLEDVFAEQIQALEDQAVTELQNVQSVFENELRALADSIVNSADNNASNLINAITVGVQPILENLLLQAIGMVANGLPVLFPASTLDRLISALSDLFGATINPPAPPPTPPSNIPVITDVRDRIVNLTNAGNFWWNRLNNTNQQANNHLRVSAGLEATSANRMLLLAGYQNQTRAYTLGTRDRLGEIRNINTSGFSNVSGTVTSGFQGFLSSQQGQAQTQLDELRNLRTEVVNVRSALMAEKVPIQLTATGQVDGQVLFNVQKSNLIKIRDADVKFVSIDNIDQASIAKLAGG